MRWCKELFFGGILLALISFSCSPIYYAPTTQPEALISEKGELSLNGSFADKQIDFNGNYGLSHNIALMTNISYFPSQGRGDEYFGSNRFSGSGQKFEVGLGYYNLFHKLFVFESYGFLGQGKMENHLGSGNDRFISSDIFLFGIQSNIGIKWKYVSMAISAQLKNLKYGNIDGNLIHEQIDQINYLKNNSNQTLLEPAFTFRFGIDNVKLQFQVGQSYNLTNTDFKQEVFNATVGIHFRMNTLKKK